MGDKIIGKYVYYQKNKLGEGGFGKVYKGIDIETG